ncbi:MAG: hypothetical protein FJ225_01315 [Lentisphaerae bacterium]|nr:hypothetical protein [Lentisphaerota bacterium]
MPRPWRIRFPGAKYHVTVRGNARQTIYHAQSDYRRFMEQLTSALERDEVVLYAYCLLPNHGHLLVETPLGNIHRFMQRLNTAYGMYRRYKRNRPGHCFQGRYGAKLVGGDEYILRVSRYIHLNPVRIKRMEAASASEKTACLNDYPWSSYGGYVDGKRIEEIVNYRWLRLMDRSTPGRSRIAYRAYVESMVDGEDPVLKEAMGASCYAIGDGEFRAQVHGELREVRLNKGAYGDIAWPLEREPDMDVVTQTVAGELGADVQELRRHGRRAGVAKMIAIELCCRLCGKSQREVGRSFGYKGNGAVGKQRAKLRELMAGDEALRRQLTRLRKKLAEG